MLGRPAIVACLFGVACATGITPPPDGGPLALNTPTSGAIAVAGQVDEWTFFGRALFPEALAHSYSFEDAFDQASAEVARRERAEGFEASLPQVAIGNGIRVALKGLEQRLAATHPARN